MIEIELKPCYPEGSTEQEQLEYIKCEYEELIEAIENENWEDQAKEALDVAQTVQGYRDIRNEKLLEFEYRRPEYGLRTLKMFWDYYDREVLIIADLYKMSLGYFCYLICKHDRGNENYRRELLDRFLQEHEEKLQSRRKEWSECSAQAVEKKSI